MFRRKRAFFVSPIFIKGGRPLHGRIQNQACHKKTEVLIIMAENIFKVTSVCMWPRRSLSVLSTFSEVYPLLPPPEKKNGGGLTLALCRKGRYCNGNERDMPHVLRWCRGMPRGCDGLNTQHHRPARIDPMTANNLRVGKSRNFRFQALRAGKIRPRHSKTTTPLDAIVTKRTLWWSRTICAHLHRRPIDRNWFRTGLANTHVSINTRARAKP